MNDKIKVLITVGSMGIGGNEIFVINLVENIDYNLFDVDVLIFSSLGINEENVNRLKKYANKVFIADNIRQKDGMWQDMKIVTNLVRKNKYDLVHCNSCSLLGLIKVSLPSKISTNTKIISHSHNSGKANPSSIRKITSNFLKFILMNTIDYGLACSDKAAKAKYSDKFIKSNRFSMIRNSIDIKKYSFNDVKRLEIRGSLGVLDDELLIGNIGRLDDQKNQKYLLYVIKELNDTGITSKCLLVGDGPHRDELINLSKKLCIEDKVILVGNRADANDFYNAMDCFVMTSIYEGFPFVMTEAQVNGLYCIVSDVISRDTNVSGLVKYLPLDGNYKNWATEISEIKDLRMPELNTNKVIEKYDVKNEIKRIEKIYRDLICQ